MSSSPDVPETVYVASDVVSWTRGEPKAYRLPSSDPTYTTPFATAGEESTELSVAPVHRGEHVVGDPEHPVAPAASKAYNLPSFDPTYTTPLATAGEERTRPPVPPVHR